MSHRETYRHTLRHALAISGGRLFLAERLHVGAARLSRWLAGEEFIPDEIFLHAVDIIVAGYERRQLS